MSAPHIHVVDPNDHLVDLTKFGLGVGGSPLDHSADFELRHPVVAMTHGVSATLHRAGYCGVDDQAAKLRALLHHAVDTAEPGEPRGNLFKIPMTLFDNSGALEAELWVKQNHPHNHYIVLWPDEY